MRLVALTVEGRYLRVAALDGETRLRADGGSIDAAAVFERLVLSHDRVALRTLDGRFLACCPDSGYNFGLYPEDELTPRAAFEEILWPDGQVSLRSSELTFVSAGVADAPSVTANRIEAGSLERFRYVPVPASPAPQRLPGQRHGAPDATVPLVRRFPGQGVPARHEEHSRTHG